MLCSPFQRSPMISWSGMKRDVDVSARTAVAASAAQSRKAIVAGSKRIIVLASRNLATLALSRIALGVAPLRLTRQREPLVPARAGEGVERSETGEGIGAGTIS